jgi:guanylate kinase
MKKILLSSAVIASMMFVSCGPSAEEIAAKEKAKQDSIQKVEEERMMKEAEEMAAKAKEDSIATAKAVEDSIAAAAAAEAKTKKAPAKKKTMEQKVKEEAKKTTSGRG